MGNANLQRYRFNVQADRRSPATRKNASIFPAFGHRVARSAGRSDSGQASRWNEDAASTGRNEERLQITGNFPVLYETHFIYTVVHLAYLVLQYIAFLNLLWRNRAEIFAQNAK